ncbi:MAG: acyl-CoA dehydrogenase family protein [Rubricoccaceae bacterium]|nr:acyl-CoA dehydrogenase family protein [Rubricoccaceae bacterium]
MAEVSIAPPVELESVDDYLRRLSATLEALRNAPDAAAFAAERGSIVGLMEALRPAAPTAAFVPSRYGGRGGHADEWLAVLEVAGYHWLGLTLTLGITGALFVQPLARYGEDELQRRLLPRFAREGALGGFMMTEPDHGTDALGIRTAFRREGNGFRVSGTKHWAGLTGVADYWLVAAREDAGDAGLKHDVRLFLLDTADPSQRPRVVQHYDSLGLYSIPYGRSTVDAYVPEAHMIGAQAVGLDVLMDILARSRLAFAGMGMGYLRRLADEALALTQDRSVGSTRLISFDVVQGRLSRIQTFVSVCSALCLRVAGLADLGRDLSGQMQSANITKALVSDFMHEGAQHLLQLSGARGYRLSHVAGRSVVDSRPFQIFEGSNDVLYHQIARRLLKEWLRREVKLDEALAAVPDLARGAAFVASAHQGFAQLDLGFAVSGALPQRRMVDLGRLVACVYAAGAVLDLRDTGYDARRISSALINLRHEVEALAVGCRRSVSAPITRESTPPVAWRAPRPPRSGET